jgi:ribosomal protein S27AE
MKNYTNKIKEKIEEFKQQKTGLDDPIAKTIVDAKINTLKWALRQANGVEQSDSNCNKPHVSNAKRTCPHCGSTKIIMFTSDLDMCQKCNAQLEGA